AGADPDGGIATQPDIMTGKRASPYTARSGQNRPSHHAAGRCADVETEPGDRTGVTFDVPVICMEPTGEPSTGGDDRADSGTDPAIEPSDVHLRLLLGCGGFAAESCDEQDDECGAKSGSRHLQDSTLEVTPKTVSRGFAESDRRAPTGPLVSRAGVAI